MSRVAVAAVGVVAGVAAWVAYRRSADIGAGVSQVEQAFVDWGNQVGNQVNDAVSSLGDTFGFVRVGNMAAVDRSILGNANVRAFLRVIRQGESSQDDSIAYRMIVGRQGAQFSSFADHPRIFGTPTSTAAGAYQITKTTWDWVRGQMGLKDFSPASQDAAALGLIAYRGALLDVLNGNLEAAIPKLRKEWTSLPGAAENNAAAGSMAKAKSVFIAYGGSLGGPVYA